MKKKNIIIIGSVLIVIVIICLLFKKDTVINNNKNTYNYESKRIELPNTVKYTNDNLEKIHCINDICVSNLVFYTSDTISRIEYKIYNSGNDRKSGLLRLNFSNQYLVIVYDGVLGKSTVSSFSEFEGINITNKDDYILEEYNGNDIINKNK